MTIQEFKKLSIAELKSSSPSPALDTDVLIEHALNFSKTELLLKNNNQIEEEKLKWLYDALEKRKTGLPVAYITGYKEFYGYNFHVNPDVLIPKPDTEILVERAIEIIIEKMEAHPVKILSVCDMCTGSGCIGISVMKTLLQKYKISPSALPKFTLADISAPALETARKNADSLILSLAEDSGSKVLLESKLCFIQSNLFEMLPYQYDIILSNPPYIPHSMVEDLLKDGRNEPRLALDGDISLCGERAKDKNGQQKDDGLSVIKNLILQSKDSLCTMGTALVETGEYNAKQTAEFAEKSGFSAQIHKDLEGQLRVVELNKKL